MFFFEKKNREPPKLDCARFGEPRAPRTPKTRLRSFRGTPAPKSFLKSYRATDAEFVGFALALRLQLRSCLKVFRGCGGGFLKKSPHIIHYLKLFHKIICKFSYCNLIFLASDEVFNLNYAVFILTAAHNDDMCVIFLASIVNLLAKLFSSKVE